MAGAQLHGRRLGGFVLDAPLARGAMGEVWSATHAETGLRAAVKVVGGATPALAEALRREIRSAAALSDPRIVQLYDAGDVADDLPGIPAGAPWLAMELLGGGTLTQRRLDWPSARRVLDDLLAALAHAHAHGLLHRDLKPDNVMFDAAGGTRLVDFGVGVRLDEAGRIRPSGTPLWMAPEQFEADGRQLGPWTDLYALGCIAYWLAAGAPPFPNDAPPVLRRAHAEAPFPTLRATTPVPDGLSGFLARLTAKSPRDRFRRAADARAALAALPDPEVAEAVGRRAPAAATLAPSAWTLTTPDDAPAATEAPGALPAAAAGLGLVRLREAPLTGRRHEQARLLERFARAAAGHSVVVVLHGPSGSGKTRLATWLCREVHALGHGAPFRAAHAPEHGDGLGGLVARALRIDAAEPTAAVRARLEAEGLPSPYALAEVVRPSAAGLGAPLEQRCATVAAALRHLAEGRVPVVWIDDAQWSAEGMALARHLAARAEPWLVVLTAREPIAFPGAEILALGALDAEDAAALASGIAALAPAARAALVRHTAGSPLFLVELFGEWVGRGRLMPSPAGWRLTDGPEAWPADLPTLWRARLLRVLDRDGRWLGLLAVAAALGAEVDVVELERACAIGGLPDPAEAVSALFSERLAAPEPAFQGRRWSFVHPSLREAVVALAAERGLLLVAHRACAQMLTAGSPATEERRAAHLEAAGDLPAAVDALLVARPWQTRRDLDAAQRAMDRVERILAQMPRDDRRSGELWVARSRIALVGGRPTEALQWVERAMASPDATVRALGQLDRGRLWRLQDRGADAIADLTAAVAALEALGEQEQRAVALGERGIALRDAARFAEADASFADGMALTADPVRRAELATLRAGIAIAAGHAAEAIGRLELLASAFDGPDLAFPRATFLYHRAFAQSALGAWAEAERDLSEAVAMRYGMGSRAGSWVTLWAALLVLVDRVDDAEEVLDTHEVGGDPSEGLPRAAIAAARGAWDEVAPHLARAYGVFPPALEEALRAFIAAARRRGRQAEDPGSV
jgi:tetratricopeptide (TPR) repeat protein